MVCDALRHLLVKRAFPRDAIPDRLNQQQEVCPPSSSLSGSGFLFRPPLAPWTGPVEHAIAFTIATN